MLGHMENEPTHGHMVRPVVPWPPGLFWNHGPIEMFIDRLNMREVELFQVGVKLC